MAENMSSLTHLPLTLIVAATAKNGIGKNGGLPWPMLKKDMAYFARVTKRVPTPKNTGSVQSDALKESILAGASRNVVIMGRKTWDSIPPKFRPLKDRTHIVISSQDRSQLQTSQTQPIPEDVVVATDILSGLRSLEALVKDGRALSVGRAFVIGGASIYKAALELPQTNRILLTRISKEYECDTFFPESYESSEWHLASHQDLQEFVGEEVEEGDVADGEVRLGFQLYERS
jgi:dihydrofolate reductase